MGDKETALRQIWNTQLNEENVPLPFSWQGHRKTIEAWIKHPKKGNLSTPRTSFLCFFGLHSPLTYPGGGRETKGGVCAAGDQMTFSGFCSWIQQESDCSFGVKLGSWALFFLLLVYSELWGELPKTHSKWAVEAALQPGPLWLQSPGLLCGQERASSKKLSPPSPHLGFPHFSTCHILHKTFNDQGSRTLVYPADFQNGYELEKWMVHFSLGT